MFSLDTTAVLGIISAYTPAHHSDNICSAGRKDTLAVAIGERLDVRPAAAARIRHAVKIALAKGRERGNSMRASDAKVNCN
jgi:hypothetical protein